MNRWMVLALVAAVTLAYAPAFSAPFVMDDADTIGASVAGVTLECSPTAGRPLVKVTLQANSALNDALGVDQRRDPDGPHKAVGYRLFNLLLHLLSGALLFSVLRRALRERQVPEAWRASADSLAGVVTALWLLHPIQSEAVNYIVQRSESLASLAYLGALLASQRAWEEQPRRAWWYLIAVACAVLGMLSKEIVISVPLAVMLYDRAFRLSSWRALLVPGDGRGWLYAALWLSCLGTLAVVAIGARGETAGFGVAMPWYDYFYTQCWAIAHYLRLALWPSPLAIDYGTQTVGGWRGVPGAALLVALAAATVAAWVRVERYGWFAFAGTAFFMLLAPSSSVVPVPSEVAAERRVYLALAAVILVLVVAVEYARRRLAPRVALFTTAAVPATVALVAMLALGAATAVRSHEYASVESLWRSAVLATPDNPRALGNLGWALFRSPAPKLAEAESVYARAMQRDTTCRFGCLQYATVLSHAGRYADATPLLDRVIARDAGSAQGAREWALAQRELALVLMKQGKYDLAIPHLELVAARFPSMDHVAVLGIAYLSSGRRAEALAAFQQVASLDGGSPDMQRLSARLLDGASRPELLGDLQQFAWQLARDWM